MECVKLWHTNGTIEKRPAEHRVGIGVVGQEDRQGTRICMRLGGMAPTKPSNFVLQGAGRGMQFVDWQVGGREFGQAVSKMLLEVCDREAKRWERDDNMRLCFVVPRTANQV